MAIISLHAGPSLDKFLAVLLFWFGRTNGIRVKREAIFVGKVWEEGVMR